MTTPSSRFVPYLALVLAGLIGPTSLLAFFTFLYAGPFAVIDPALGPMGQLAWDALLSAAFFLQHSGMIRRSFRRRLARVIAPQYQGAFYTVASGIVLLSVVLFWQRSGDSLVDFQDPYRWAIRAVFFLAVAGIVWGLHVLGSFDAFGLNPILTYLRGTKASPLPLTVRGPYRWVRHPLYLLMILAIWLRPDVTLDRLLFDVLWTAWIVVGTVLEERDLVTDFGDDYRDYQRRVPMLVPRWIKG